jgi:hypothetical protein
MLGRTQSLSERHGEEKILGPYWDSNFDLSVIQPVDSRYTDYVMLVDNIKMDLRERGWGGDLAQNRDQCRALVNTVMDLRVP